MGSSGGSPTFMLILVLVLAAGSVVVAAPARKHNGSGPGPLPPLPEPIHGCPASIYDHSVNSKGSVKFPVFHKKHPCLVMSEQTQSETRTIDVIEDTNTNNFLFLMPVLLGTPPVMNLVAIDTGATFPWVQCQPCSPFCHDQSEQAGQIFDPTKSTTFRGAKCISRECFSIKYGLNLLFANCMEKEDTCLYAMSYGNNWVYTAGKVVWDNVIFGKDSAITNMSLLFGCSQAANYPHKEAGIFGFGRDSYSFFEQVASNGINYKAFSYCLPADETVRGYMVLGDYSREDVETYTPLFPSTFTPTYSLRLVRFVANGQSIPVASSSSEMMVDSGAMWTLLSADTFTSLNKVMTEAMAQPSIGYERNYRTPFNMCFFSRDYSLGKTERHQVFSNWSSLPLVEMVFDGAAAMPILAKNLFYNDPNMGLCAYFRTDSGFKFQILGNRVTRSFETIFDIQGNKFGFRSAAC